MNASEQFFILQNYIFFAFKPPTSILNDISKLKHPNSRKTKSVAKKAKR